MSEEPGWLAREAGPGLRVSDELSIGAVLRLVLSLSRRAQLEVYEQLGAYLAEIGEPESKHAAAVRRQREALDVLERVAEAAQLAPGKAPTRTQYEEHASRLGITLSVSAIGRTFRTWANAQAMYERRVLPETARQVRQRQVLQSHSGRTPVEHIALLNEWADQAEDLTKGSYERWRKHYVAEVGSGELPVPLGARHLTRLFPGLTFEEIVELRRSAADLTAVARERVEAALAEHPNPLGLVSFRQAAALLGKPENVLRTVIDAKRNGLVVVAVVSGALMLLIDDVRTFARTGRVAETRRHGELQDKLYDRAGLATALGLTKKRLEYALAHRPGDIPAPDGRVGGHEYWLASTVESWCRPDKNG